MAGEYLVLVIYPGLALGSAPIMAHFDSLCCLRFGYSCNPTRIESLTDVLGLVSEVDGSIVNTYQLAVSDFTHRNIDLHKDSSRLHNVMRLADTDVPISFMESSFHCIHLDPSLVVLDKVFDVIVNILDFFSQSSINILLWVDFVLAPPIVPLSNTIRYVELPVIIH